MMINQDTTKEPLHKRTIRSFVLRTGRMTESQKRAYDQLWPRYGLTIDQGMQNFAQLFQRNAPTVFEIGFGMGDSLAQMAAAAPDADFIGVEVHRPGVGRLLRLANERQLNNLRLYADDAVEVLSLCIPDQSLDRVQLFFPDPWHKKKHHKRRIVQPGFMHLIAAKLKPGGIFHAATDWENYAEHMMQVLTDTEGWENPQGVGNFSPRPDYRPGTKFEARGERLGHGVWDLIFRRL